MKWFGIINSIFEKRKIKSQNQISDAEYEYLKLRIEFLEKLLSEKTNAVEKAKSLFLKNLYHEIRTPLNAIVGFANLLELNDANENDTLIYLTHIKDSSQNFLDKMDKIIEASIIEAGIIKLYNEDCKIYTLLSELHSYFSIHKHICEKELAFLLSVPDELKELVIKCDVYRIKQVLTNLLVNAFKFTEKGFVEFGYKVLNNEVEFFVRDTGIGGLEGKEDIIYNIFTKLDESDTSTEGLGLGLRLAKRMAEIMGGNLRFNSTSGKGSTFYFTIPFQPIPNLKSFKDRKYSAQSDTIQKTVSKGTVVF
jgi:signal transduction histidine kinase